MWRCRGSYRILISGKQPESTKLLRQLVVAEPGRCIRSAGSPTLDSMPSGIEVAAGGDHDALRTGAGWRAGSMDFKAAADLMPITLAYHRPMGQAAPKDPWRSAPSLIEKQPNR